MSRAFVRICALHTASLVPLVADATAASPNEVVIAVRAAARHPCLDEVEVVRAAGHLLPHRRLLSSAEARGKAPNRVTVNVDAVGPAVNVRVGQSVRRLARSASCTETVRAIAVVAALLVEPPLFTVVPPLKTPHRQQAKATPSPTPIVRRENRQDNKEAKTSSTPPPRALATLAVGTLRAPITPQPRRQLRAEVAVVLDSASMRRDSLAGGVSLRVVWGRERIALTAGAAVLSAASLDLGIAEARLFRIPFDVGVRGAIALNPLLLGLDLSAVVSATTVSGRALPESASETRAEWGLRAALNVGFGAPRRRVRPFISLSAVVVPSPIAIAVSPIGRIGETEHLRLGVALGFSVGAD